MPNRPTVFLSYRRQSNADLARFIYDRLSRMGVDVFFDVEAINGGRFAEIISKQIAAREFFIVILSPNTLESEWVRREVAAAIKGRKHIIPLETLGFDFSKHVPNELHALSEYGGIPYDFKAPEKAFERIARALGLKHESVHFPLPIIYAVLAAVVIIAALFILRSNVATTNSTITPPTLTVEPVTQSPDATSTTLIQPTVTIEPTLPPVTLIFPPIPTSSPVVASTVVNVQSKAYPCDGTIAISSGQGVALNQMRAIPQRNGPARTPATQGENISILAKQHSVGEDWYQITYANGQNNGWLLAEYVIASSNCPS